MMVWKMIFLLNQVIFKLYVNFPGCKIHQKFLWAIFWFLKLSKSPHENSENGSACQARWAKKMGAPTIMSSKSIDMGSC